MTDDLPFLQSDRIIFKLYACEEHLKNIKNINLQYGDLVSKGARINKLNDFTNDLSGIPSDRIEIDKVVSVLLDESKRIELANELKKANEEPNLYWMIKHLRNYSLHSSLLSAEASLDVIPYFEQILVQLKDFINNIKMKEPILQ